jgi:putative xylitol transport system ATP-binding protein
VLIGPTGAASGVAVAGEVESESDRSGAVGATSDILLSAVDVAKSYSGVPALFDGCIKLRRGSVHALCGGNGAGKSTFLNILVGLHQADAGIVLCKGRAVRYASPAEAFADGVAIITQELSPVLDMTVAENVHLGREPRRAAWFVDKRRMISATRSLFERLRMDIDPKARMRSLSVGQIQLVEIAKAIDREGEILIMDEPTSAIGERETDILFETIRSLQAHGVGIIYVSHRIADIFSIADSYTVLRDGRFVETGAVANIDRQRLISLIVGRSLSDHEKRPAVTARGEVMFAAKSFSRGHSFQDINIDVARGEIVGLYGLLGSGRSEFVNAVYGNEPKDSGEVFVEGRRIDIRTPADALRCGMAIVTEDRKETGLVLTSSVRTNISIAALRRFSRFGAIVGRREVAAVDRQIAHFAIKTASREVPVMRLSGGNQQKVVFARCVETAPRILICDEPTRGIDEGAKRDVYAFLASFAAEGNAVLLISSEVIEILANTDRIIVFRRGRIAGELRASTATQQALVHLAG